MIETLIQYVLSPIIAAAMGYVIYLLKESKKTEDANAKGTMLLLRRQIINDYSKYVEKGEPMTAFDFDDINEIHTAYKGLNGNGLTDKMFETLSGIDIKSEETK